MDAAPDEFAKRVAARSAQADALHQLDIRASEIGTGGGVKLAVIVAQLQTDIAKLQSERPVSRWQRIKRWALGRGALA